jgi:hypothetical protein
MYKAKEGGRGGDKNLPNIRWKLPNIFRRESERSKIGSAKQGGVED